MLPTARAKQLPSNFGLSALEGPYCLELLVVLVPGGGVEPPRGCPRRILSPLRLPVPPSRLGRCCHFNSKAADLPIVRPEFQLSPFWASNNSPPSMRFNSSEMRQRTRYVLQLRPSSIRQHFSRHHLHSVASKESRPSEQSPPYTARCAASRTELVITSAETIVALI
jgi:hypothetical protein